MAESTFRVDATSKEVLKETGVKVEVALCCGPESWGDRCSWHLCCDQGPKSASAISYLAVGAGLRMSFLFDLPHRVHNDFNVAVNATSLRAVKLEWKIVLAARNGPFSSGAHHRLLTECTRLMSSTGAERQPLFGCFYESIAAEHRMAHDPDYLTEEHEKK
eukprot:637915-Amphidinium_carterae.1